MGTLLAMNTHLLTLVCGLLVVAGCSEARLEGQIPLDGSSGEVRRAFAVSEYPPQRIRGELIASGQSGPFYRNARNGDHVTWRAPDGSALVTRDGALTATFGLGYDLLSADVSDTLGLIRSRRAGSATRVHRYLDGENQVITRAFLCEVEFPGGAGDFRRVRETCNGADITFENSYVLAADGRIVTSRQWVGPRIGVIRLSPLEPRPSGPNIVVVGI